MEALIGTEIDGVGAVCWTTFVRRSDSPSRRLSWTVGLVFVSDFASRLVTDSFPLSCREALLSRDSMRRGNSLSLEAVSERPVLGLLVDEVEVVTALTDEIIDVGDDTKREE